MVTDAINRLHLLRSVLDHLYECQELVEMDDDASLDVLADCIGGAIKAVELAKEGMRIG